MWNSMFKEHISQFYRLGTCSTARNECLIEQPIKSVDNNEITEIVIQSIVNTQV